MTRDEFLNKLRTFKGSFRLTNQGCIRNTDGCCPIEAIANTPKGTLGIATRLTKLEQDVRADVIYGADNIPNIYMAYSSWIMRKKMMEVLGLTENLT